MYGLDFLFALVLEVFKACNKMILLVFWCGTFYFIFCSIKARITHKTLDFENIKTAVFIGVGFCWFCVFLYGICFVAGLIDNWNRLFL